MTRPSPDALRQELGDRVAELGEFIKSQREVASMSVRRLADLAGVSNPYLSQIERGLRAPSERVIEAIARSLDTSADDLYEEAGLAVPRRDGEDGRARVEAVLAADRALLPHQRRVLLDVYDALVAAGPAPPPPRDRLGPAGGDAT